MKEDNDEPQVKHQGSLAVQGRVTCFGGRDDCHGAYSIQEGAEHILP